MTGLSKQDRKICETALRLTARQGWKKVTLDRIAKAAKIPKALFEKRFTDTSALLPLLVEYGTECALASCEKPKISTPIRDRIFEVIMARFDFLQQNRESILSIATASRGDSKMALILLRAQVKAMQKMLQHANVSNAKLCENFYLSGFLLIFFATFRVWQSDETLDMSKTMAALDKSLRYAESTARLLRINSV